MVERHSLHKLPVKHHLGKKIRYNKKFTLNSQDHEDDVIDLCLQSRNILLNMQKYISYDVRYNSEGNFFSYKIQS